MLKYLGCSYPPPSPCDAIWAEASQALALARACNPASAAAATCAASVPTNSCDVPVAAGDSEETKKYLEIFESYVEAGCPFYDPPCPADVAGICSETADGTARCEWVATNADGTKD